MMSYREALHWPLMALPIREGEKIHQKKSIYLFPLKRMLACLKYSFWYCICIRIRYVNFFRFCDVIYKKKKKKISGNFFFRDEDTKIFMYILKHNTNSVIFFFFQNSKYSMNYITSKMAARHDVMEIEDFRHKISNNAVNFQIIKKNKISAINYSNYY